MSAERVPVVLMFPDHPKPSLRVQSVHPREAARSRQRVWFVALYTAGSLLLLALLWAVMR